jgi:hypothetical protein
MRLSLKRPPGFYNQLTPLLWRFRCPVFVFRDYFTVRYSHLCIAL